MKFIGCKEIGVLMYRSGFGKSNLFGSGSNRSRVPFLTRIALLFIVLSLVACGGGNSDGDNSGSSSSSSSGGGLSGSSYSGSSSNSSFGEGELPLTDLKFVHVQALPGGDAVNPKLLQLSWAVSGKDVERVEKFTLEYNPDGSSGFHTLLDNLDKSARSVELELPMHLVEWDSARYQILAVDQKGNELAGSEEIPLAAVVKENMIGHFKAADQGVGDRFGEQLALSGDGKTLAIGVPTKENPEGIALGGVYIFRKSVDGWIEEAALTVKDQSFANRVHNFGFRVAMSGDGRKLAVFSALGLSFRQPLHVFSRGVDGWELVAESKTRFCTKSTSVST